MGVSSVRAPPTQKKAIKKQEGRFPCVPFKRHPKRGSFEHVGGPFRLARRRRRTNCSRQCHRAWGRHRPRRAVCSSAPLGAVAWAKANFLAFGNHSRGWFPILFNHHYFQKPTWFCRKKDAWKEWEGTPRILPCTCHTEPSKILFEMDLPFGEIPNWQSSEPLSGVRARNTQPKAQKAAFWPSQARRRKIGARCEKGVCA